MTHPTPDELSDFLYQDLPRDRQAAIAGHLEACPECSRQVEAWRTVRRNLAQWTEAAPARQAQPLRPCLPWWTLVRWAAAAAILLGLGFGAARLTMPAAPDIEALRAGLTAELREQLRADFEQFAANQAERDAAFQQAVAKTLGQLEAGRLIDYASLRRDVETVAVLAQDELETTRLGLARLINLEP